MSEIVFRRKDALEAIRRVDQNGQDWLYVNYPKPNGRPARSRTGFLLHEGVTYPVKPLGRLANEIAGRPMTTNPTTNYFRDQFRREKFVLVENLTSESEEAIERQRRLAEAWSRPDQARFRREVFEALGARCLISECEDLVALEAAHILPVSQGGLDQATNGLPLRADLHRLFDAHLIGIHPDTLRVWVSEELGVDYRDFEGANLNSLFEATQKLNDYRAFLKARLEKVG